MTVDAEMFHGELIGDESVRGDDTDPTDYSICDMSWAKRGFGK